MSLASLRRCKLTHLRPNLVKPRKLFPLVWQSCGSPTHQANDFAHGARHTSVVPWMHRLKAFVYRLAKVRVLYVIDYQLQTVDLKLHAENKPRCNALLSFSFYSSVFPWNKEEGFFPSAFADCAVDHLTIYACAVLILSSWSLQTELLKHN